MKAHKYKYKNRIHVKKIGRDAEDGIHYAQNITKHPHLSRPAEF